MSLMSVPERISDFLSQRQERMYCDTCIQERLGLKWRQQVQLITATLAVTTTFQREFNKCCTCEEIKQVTHAVDVSSWTSALPEKPLMNGSPRRERLDARFGAGRVQGVDFRASAKPSVGA
jgi:hypothetical protein